MSTFLITAATGFVATGFMSLSLYLVHWRGIANADMINAVGSLVTKNEETAMAPGLLIHFGTGIAFAFVYVASWSLFIVPSFSSYLTLGLISGVGHGLVVSFVLVALVAEHHPLPRFQEAGLGVAVAHLLAHVVYGAVIGIGAGSYGLRFDFVPVLAEMPQ